MLRIPCPCCGERNHDEFRYGGDATLERPSVDETDPEAWYAYVYIRHNPQGLHREYWQHVMGCRQWLVVERDTLTHRIGEARLARRGEPE
jgi:heterotetrameric sarcosine oxidase delta subunit